MWHFIGPFFCLKCNFSQRPNRELVLKLGFLISLALNLLCLNEFCIFLAIKHIISVEVWIFLFLFGYLLYSVDLQFLWEMVTGGSNINKTPTVDDYPQGGPASNLEDNFQSELELILQAQRCNQRIERDLDIYRSGSAPPTAEGSLSAAGSLFRNYNLSGINGVSNNVTILLVTMWMSFLLVWNFGFALGGHGIGHGFNRLGNQVGPDLHSPVLDSRYPQYLQRITDYATCPVATSSDPPVRNYFGTSDGDLDSIQKAYLETLLVQQKQQYELPLLPKSGGLNQGYHRNSSYGLGMPYPENLVAKYTLPFVGSGGYRSGRAAHLASAMRSSMGGSTGTWQSDIGCNAERRQSSSFIDEFKNKKTGSFELSGIVGHVVEFRYINWILALVFVSFM